MKTLGFIVLDIVSSRHVSTEKGGAHTFQHLDRGISARFAPPSQLNVRPDPALMHGMHRQQED